VWIDATAICSDERPALWQLVWVPAQLITLCIAAYTVIGVWRDATRDAQQPGKNQCA
jgi:hypothetical protein